MKKLPTALKCSTCNQCAGLYPNTYVEKLGKIEKLSKIWICTCSSVDDYSGFLINCSSKIMGIGESKKEAIENWNRKMKNGSCGNLC